MGRGTYSEMEVIVPNTTPMCSVILVQYNSFQFCLLGDSFGFMRLWQLHSVTCHTWAQWDALELCSDKDRAESAALSVPVWKGHPSLCPASPSRGVETEIVKTIRFFQSASCSS